MSDTHRPLRTRWVAAAAALPLTLTLAACGSDGGDASARPTFPTQAPALWNPCDALDAAMIDKAFGAHVKEADGTPTAPDCRFVPVDPKAGDPALNANYQLTPLDLDTYWKHMGIGKAKVRSPKIALADGAKIVVDERKSQLYVSGFVQNGDLFQVINLVDPAPYDKARAITGIQAVLTALSKRADKAGAGVSPSATPTTGS
ncbi:hypothetical protein [Nocardioides montaniterrae]